MRRTGFTIIELLVVIAMMGLLFAIVQPMLSIGGSRARDFGCQSNLKQVAIGLSAYAQDYGVYPGDLDAVDAVLGDRSLLRCTGTSRPYIYNSPPNDAPNSHVILTCIDPRRAAKSQPHRTSECYFELTVGGEVREVDGRRAGR